jgi:hypothetical protein
MTEVQIINNISHAGWGTASKLLRETVVGMVRGMKRKGGVER